MTKARQNLISLSDTPYYHCINRCVRRAFLCGEDQFTGQSYEHRKQWIVRKIKELSSVFAIDVCAYAVLSNHYHTVLYVDGARQANREDGCKGRFWEGRFKSQALLEFTGSTGNGEPGLPFHFADYLELVDWTGRAVWGEL